MKIIWCFCAINSIILLPVILALFEDCNHDIELKDDDKIYINSPYYPANYPIGTSCRYTVRAPADRKLEFKCDISLNTPPSATRCSNEIFYFNREGSELLTGSEYFCGTGTMKRKSIFNRAVISYISTPNYRRNIPKVAGGIEAIEEDTEAIEQMAAAIEVPPQEGDTFNLDISMLLKEDKSDEKDAEKKDMQLSTAFQQVVAMLSNTSAGLITTATTTRKSVTKVKSKRRKTSTTTSTTASLIATQKSSSDHIETVEKSLPSLITGIVERLENRLDLSNCSSKATSISESALMYRIFSGSTNSSSSTLPTLSSRIFIKSPKIVADGGNYFGKGGGSFSCFVEVVEPDCECGRNAANYTQFGSQEAALNEFPSMAGVMTVRSNRIFCGAAIIHNRFLLSAAHCFNTSATNDPEDIRIVVGEHDLTTVFESLYTRYYNIDRIILHENFRTSSRGVRNDIALLRTSSAMEWNRGVSPVCLPFKSFTDDSGTSRRPPIPGQRLQVAGWGTISFGGPQSTILRKVTLDVISSDRCKQLLRALPMYTFCTYTPGFDTCQYDSGGALYWRREERHFAVGIVSYGFACAQHRLPSVNTKVSAFVKWIKDKSNASFCEL